MFKKTIQTQDGRYEYYPHRNMTNLAIPNKGNRILKGWFGWIVKIILILFGKES